MFLCVTGKLSFMPYKDDDLRAIADAVRKARIAQKLDKEPAARAAKVSSITWKRVEDGESVRDASLSKILESLTLPDADVLLGGSGDVAVQPVAARIVLLTEVPTVDLLDELRNRVVSLDDAEGRDRITDWNERSIDAMRNPGRLYDPRYRHQ